MYSKWVVYILLFIGLLLISPGLAQEHVFFWGEELGVGSRAMGLGGAYVGVADDYSAMYWNPSGLGQVQRMEFNLGFSHNRVANDAVFLDNELSSNSSGARLNSLGFVYPVPTFRGSLVFGFGFNKVRDYDGVLEIEGFNPSYAAFQDVVMPTYYDSENPDDLQWTSAVNDSLLQQESILEEGSRNQYTLSGAVEVQENVFVGVSMNVIRGRDDYGVHLMESDNRNLYSFFDRDKKIMSDLDYWEYDRAIGTDLKATNFKLGLLYRMNKAIRLGATLTTNTTYTVKENWSEDWAEYYDTADEAATFAYESNYTYKIQEPYTLGVGVSFNAANVLLSAAADFTDWSQAKFLTDPPVASVSQAEINRTIRHDLTDVTTLRLGAEVFLPVVQARLRGGYVHLPSPYKDETIRPNKNFYSGGVGFLLDKQVMLDLTYVRGQWQQESSDDLTYFTTQEDKTFSKLIGTLSIRF